MKDITVDKRQYRSSFSLANKIMRVLWHVVYYIFFRPFSPHIFDKWRIFLLKCFGAKIDWSVRVYSTAKIWAPWNLEMEPYTTMGRRVDCYNQGKITIKAHTTISQKSYLCASTHDISDPGFPLVLKPICIDKEAWIAADAFIGPGVHVGRGAVVAARSAVFSDVEPWTVVGGNPAKLIKTRDITNES